jgi:hypothetical protein
MVAGIFALHGFWVGKSCRSPDKFNAKGYYENLAVKHCMKSKFRDNIKQANKGKVYDIKPTETRAFKLMIEHVIKRDGYRDDEQPWLVKFGASYWKPWKRVYPNGTTICLFRNAKAVIASGQRTFKVTQERIEAAHRLMEEALQSDTSDCVFRVDYEEIIAGNYSQLVAPFRRENVEIDFDVVNDFVDPNLCHFGVIK